jgi:prepilin-type N-terminal cleavage/methylation domain-containing protein/prepilin-type processing-associated H-X9-DG protein
MKAGDAVARTRSDRATAAIAEGKEAQGAGRRAGFTLIELLVVIAIIALLVSILLPSLNAAKELARSSVCLSHLRGAGIGFNNYASIYDGYLAGPNTSGYAYRRPGRPPTGSDSNIEPMQSDDWMSPVMGSSLGLAKDRNTRLIQLFNSQFRCPSNRENYDYMYGSGGGDWPEARTVSYNSYSAPLTLHVYNDSDAAAAAGQPYGLCFSGPDAGTVDVRPANHRFQIDTIGPPALKVAAMDGARYVNSEGLISFNTSSGTEWGANFMNRGPCLNVYYQDSGNPYKYDADGENLHPFTSKYAYRHNDKLNMAFLDGHAESMSHEESRKVTYWYPTGTIIMNPSMVGDKNVDRFDVVN